MLVFPASNDLVDSVQSVLGRTSLFREGELVNALLKRGLEGEKGEPDKRLDGVPVACCGVGENPTVYREVDRGDAE